MAYKVREEIVGKRFLSVSAGSAGAKFKCSKLSELCWRAGVIRAATHRDNFHKDLQVLVEYDDREWQRREWVCVHKAGIFQAFLVEKTLVWTSRSETHRALSGALAPALTFLPLVGVAELAAFDLEPIEFLRDRHVAFRDPTNFRHVQDYERRWGEDSLVAEWIRAQNGQSILLATPSVLVGYRVQVYRSEGTTQWYTAVIVGYNEGTRELTVTDDTVLEDHNEDPCLVQMRLIGDGVVESIMRGENVGITPRRSRSNLTLQIRQPNRGKKAIKNPKKLSRRSTVSGPAVSKPPAQPPDRGKRSARSPNEFSDLGKESPLRESEKASTDREDRRSLRSLRSHSAEKAEVKVARPFPRVKKKDKELRREEKKNKPPREPVSSPAEPNSPPAEPVSPAAEPDSPSAQPVTPSPEPVSPTSLEPVVVLDREASDDVNTPVENGVDDKDDLADDKRDENAPETVAETVVTCAPRETVDDEPEVKTLSESVSDGVSESKGDVSSPVVNEEPSSTAKKCDDESPNEAKKCAAQSGDSPPAIDDDDGPLPPTSPFRMEDSVGGGLLRDDRSDSGVSSLKSAGSGDERSGSRSSALSTTPPPTHRKISEVWREGGMSQPPAGYPGAPPGLLIPPPPLYSPLAPELWPTKRYPTIPTSSPHLGHPSSEELERAFHDQERRARERQREQEVRDQKEKERAEAKERERERLEKQRAAEQAVHKHFEESLRLAHKRQSSNMCWINNLPGPAGSRSEEEKRQAAVQQHHQQQHQVAAAAAAVHQQQQAAVAAIHEHSRLFAQAERFRQDAAARERERAYYQQQHHVQQQQQSRQSLSSSRVVDYPPPVPPPAHGKQVKNSGSVLNSDKAPGGHAPLPKAEPNFYGGYPRYQPTALNFLHHENAKNKEQPLNKSNPHDQLVLVKTDRAELIPNPQQMMSDLKNSVIVKNDKSPGLEKMHPQSPKMRTDYLPPAAKSPFEYRSPSQSPHPALSHSTSPFEAAQNLASISKVHMHRAQHLSPHGHPVQQRQSPHAHPAQQRQSPHQQSSHHRHSPQAMHHQQQHRQSPHAHPMHASPPYATSKPAATVASYPYPHPAQQPVHYAAAPPTPPKPKVSSPAPPPPQQLYPPPKARPHSRNEQPLPPPQGLGAAVPKPLTPSPYQQLSQHNLPPPPQAAQGGPQPPPAHSNRFTSSPGLAAVKAPSSPVQCQPLDLGVGIKLEPPPSSPSPPKRKATNDDDEVDTKKIKVESIKSEVVDDEDILDRPPSATNLSRVSEASPLIATAATTITTVHNTSLHQQVENRPETPGSKPTPPPASAVAPPSAPVTPSPADLEKSNSPGLGPPARPQAYPVHKLKKAWLQRHSGEDTTDINSSDIKGSGSCVTLPMPVNVTMTSSPATTLKKESSGVVNSLHSIGSMAVNSIKKPKGQRKNAKEQNGHVTSKAPENDDSSSSDPDRKATPQKRVPPKVKRKKGGRKPMPEEAKRKKPSVSSTDSEKESGSDKESDTNSVSAENKKKEEKTAAVGKEAKKRGRKPKTTPSKNGNEEETRKKGKDDPQERSTPWMEAIARPSISQLKKTGESFLQDAACFEVAPKLAKCRECRWTPNQRNRNTPNIFCRFFAFRRLRYTKNGQLAIAGFSDPRRDAKIDDLKLWMPPSEGAVGLDVEMSKFLLAQVGDQFCDLLLQEKEAITEHISEDKTIAWKRVVQGVREMCDVCETTLFNFHWACGKCGFVVCIDCYKGRKSGSIKPWGEAGRDRDELSWLLCTNRQPHEQEKLMLTQIIAGDSLAQIGQKVHDIRNEWGQVCHCRRLGKNSFNGKDDGERPTSEEIDALLNLQSVIKFLHVLRLTIDGEENKGEGGSGSDDDKDANYSTLRELLIRPSGKSNGSRAPSPVLGPIKKNSLETLDQVISTVIEHSVTKEETSKELKHFIRRYRRAGFLNGIPPIDPSLHVRIMTMTESSSLYPDVPHSWLCDGRLLRLLDSDNAKNYQAFQDQWKRGQPVMISDVNNGLDASLWTPESFGRDFGDSKNDLVNCMTGDIVPNQPMRKFWEGFDCVSKRLKDDSGSPMILKLKDWPPGEDFAEMLPSRFADLMKALPMAEYTHRSGRLNLASRLPDCFVRPDLGPKMYTAYGSAVHPSAGTTNLHLDISDAVNVMVYVGIPNDVEVEACNKEVYKAIDEANCDTVTRRRVREDGVLPGALWHIYMARDADKIRDLLNKVALEKGARLEPHHDPIHDQSWYLDLNLRERLSQEYGVEGYSIVQCLGDAVFIPAGAPHQVRNLHNCIKVAEDFVSPENVSHCFHLTQEFRELSDTHTNHEDKLQIKNIMYHAVKDSLAVLANSDPALYQSKTKTEETTTANNESGDDAKNNGDTTDAS